MLHKDHLLSIASFLPAPFCHIHCRSCDSSLRIWNFSADLCVSISDFLLSVSLPHFDTSLLPLQLSGTDSWYSTPPLPVIAQSMNLVFINVVITMPYKWNAESERALLLSAVTNSDHKPSTQIWTAVADELGGGLNANACQYADACIPYLLRPPSCNK